MGSCKIERQADIVKLPRMLEEEIPGLSFEEVLVFPIGSVELTCNWVVLRDLARITGKGKTTIKEFRGRIKVAGRRRYRRGDK